MFSGIVETIGRIIELCKHDGSKTLTILPNELFSDLKIGDSVSINGTCLTVIELENNLFKVTAVPETLRLTNLDLLRVGDFVNLERSLSVNARIGGHFVQGHIDSMGHISDIQKDGEDALLLKISLPAELNKYVVRKGYITIDGMSITVIQAHDNWFSITLIPHTLAATIAKDYQISTVVNLEVDLMGKYIEKLLGAHARVQTH